MKVVGMKKKKIFSLYINEKPVKINNVPLKFEEEMKIKIGDTFPGMEITWYVFKFDDGSEVWYCDRNLLNWISRKEIEKQNLTKTYFTADNYSGGLSLPDAGYDITDECEWLAIMDFLKNDKENLFHWKNCFSLGFGFVNNHVPARGNVDACGYYQFHEAAAHSSIGWRPVLRSVNHDKKSFFFLWNILTQNSLKSNALGTCCRKKLQDY